MPCLKDNTITDNPSCDPSPSSIPVEVETIFEPTLEPPHEPETNSESSAPSSSTPVPEASDPILDGSDEEEEHPELKPKLLEIINSLEIESIEYLRIILGMSSRLLLSSPSPSALPLLISLCSGTFILFTSLLLCYHCLSVGEVREMAVRKEKRERYKGCILPVISSRWRPVLRVITPIVTFLHQCRLDAAALLLGVRLRFDNPSVCAPQSSLYFSIGRLHWRW
ncbi:hypothetical protein M9H77_13051 [Catharanthus roseus]|uniref:Uncharacterized protein n=1 Tax=Catharanthus roseus TaxID=4058 RepID=A0ACC0BJB7_CATRO|nr:hypothetical protein M9H77_13051 [Catharanthus roseus]